MEVITTKGPKEDKRHKTGKRQKRVYCDGIFASTD